MTPRRSFGLLTLLAMAHFIIVGTAAVCATPGASASAPSSAHADCAPASSHSKGDASDRASELPCCSALASCTVVPLAARMSDATVVAPSVVIASATAERAPRADRPAPELPPPRA